MEVTNPKLFPELSSRAHFLAVFVVFFVYLCNLYLIFPLDDDGG